VYFVVLCSLLATAIRAQSVSEDVLCEGRSFEPNCSQGLVRIVSASYGKTDAAFCGGRDPKPWSVNCAVDVADNLKQTCQGKNSCSVPVEGQEVCSGISKYLQVIWGCDNGIPQNKLNNRNTNVVVSNSASRSNPVPLHDLSVVGSQLYILLDPPTNVLQVRWYLDQPNQVFTTETAAPFDLRGGRSWDSTSVPDGQHRIIASITFTDGTIGSVDATFNVKNGANSKAVRATAIQGSETTFVETTPTQSPDASTVVPWSLFGVACAVIVALVIAVIFNSRV